MQEGQRVQWSGHYGSMTDPSVGDQGKILAIAGRGAHVLWSTGVRAGATDLVALEDLAPTTASAQGLLDDSLDYGTLTSFAVRETFDESGEAGVINQMASLGHLSAFEGIAHEALTLIASRIRHDPSIREVIASLDEEEGERVVRLASACLIRDAFGGDA